MAAADASPPLAGNINVALGKGDLPTATMSHPSGASCEVVLTGAHVTSWKTRDGVERLFVSSASGFGGGAAIRGGIPVCFPQFSGRGPLPKHGFVRTSDQWEIAEMSSEGGVCRLVLTLADTEESRALWPHHFEARYAVILSEDGLATEFDVLNKETEADISFTAALHTYFAVADVARTRVRGLHGLTYEDNAAGGATAVEEHTDIVIDGEVDRVYLDAPETVVLRHPTDSTRARAPTAAALALAWWPTVPSALPAHGRVRSRRAYRVHAAAEQLAIRKSSSFRDVVLWNLGEAKAGGMADLGPGEWRHYVCLEAGAIGTPVTLAPGASFRGTQSFVCEPAASDEACAS
jgi:glucose-6-phosphate 1-epimerase